MHSTVIENTVYNHIMCLNKNIQGPKTPGESGKMDMKLWLGLGLEFYSLHVHNNIYDGFWKT